MEETNEEFKCPVCLTIMMEPMQLKCNHNFCSLCLKNVQDISEENFKCPLCRQQFQLKNNSFQPNKELKEKIQQSLSLQCYKQLLNEFNKLKCQQDSQIKIDFSYGNLHKMVENSKNNKNSHEWNCFIKMSKTQDKLIQTIIQKGQTQIKDPILYFIQKVEFEIDESFGWPFIKMQTPPFSITKKGYAPFTVNIKVFWSRQFKIQPTVIEHHLSFDNTGVTKKHSIKFDREFIEQIFNIK